MTSELYCRLYLDTDTHRAKLPSPLDTAPVDTFDRNEWDCVQALLQDAIGQSADGPSIDGTVFKNHGFERTELDKRPYRPIEASRWTAELDAEDTGLSNPDAFQLIVIESILSLREKGLVVTAACDFEDLIADETGWNWSSATPNPPI